VPRLLDKLIQKKLLLKTNFDYFFWFQKKTSIKKELPILKYQPLISIIVPVYDPPENFFKKCLDSVLNQTYQNWQLCLVDDCSPNSNIRKIISDYAKKDSRIKYSFRKVNGHISQASNDAITLATGEFIALLDHDDEIAPHALSSIVLLLNKSPKTDLIYSDEDKINRWGIHCDPSFKSDFALDRFLSNNYICHLSVIRKSLINKIGGFRPGYEGSQDYDLILRVIENTKNIAHIPDILYHWRKTPNSTASVYSIKSYANQASTNALTDHFKRQKIKATVQNGLKLGTFRVSYSILKKPLVSIIIPSNNASLLTNCLQTIIDNTTYQNYEITTVNNGSEKFNYSAVNNFGVTKSTGDYLLFLNNDIEIITPEWIENMLEHAQRPDIGAVGAKLLYKNGQVQHAGVILGVGGVANHNFYRLPDSISQPFPLLNAKDIVNNFSAVTGACLMVAKSKFGKVGGFDESLSIAYNDVDLCLKLNNLGFRTLYTPYAVAYHLESTSISPNRDQVQFAREQELFRSKWSKLIENDPFYNPNLPR
jgi:GT2 family glycosyltransferase